MADRDTLAPEVEALIAGQFGTKAFTYVTGLRGRHADGGLDADSLDLVRLAVNLENAFGIEFGDADVDAVETVGEVIALVRRKVGGA